MERRTFLKSSGLFAAPVVPHGETRRDHGDAINGAVDDGSKAATDAGATVVDPEIRTIQYPLAFVPAVHRPNERCRVELATDATAPEAWLRPQRGAARPRIPLERIETREGESEIWHGESVTVAEYAVPPLRGDVVETSYDIHVSWDGGADVQHGAVTLVRTFPREPKVVVLADPQTGDTGVIRQAAERSVDDRDLEEVTFVTTETLGTDPGDDRWQAFRRAVAEINLVDPDLVVMVGDIVQNADVSAKSHVEWEDAWRILNRLEAPTVTTLGNHDGYNQTGADGYRLYQRYFAPLYYSIDLRPDLHVVSANTYDWKPLDRTSLNYAVSAWGGQIREEQMAWLEADLRSWRGSHPEGDVLVLGHHDPAALQDSRGELAERTDGEPVAEQFGRGLDSELFQGGQIWYGKNRLAFRDLLAEAGVTAYFTGHVHRDRLARYHDGNIVRIETPGPDDFETGKLHYVTRDGETDDSWTQAELRELLRDPANGPLFVETTTSNSGTGQYWGWRLMQFSTEAVDPAEAGGYPADEAFLDEAIKADRDGWNADHADLGLYSYPTYRLDAEIVTATDREVALEVRSGLATAVEGESILTLEESPAVRVTGGDRVWRRTHDGTQDVRVSYEVPADDSVTVRVEALGP